MSKRLPKLNESKKICIICEGYEENDYLNTLNNLNVWKNIYDIHLSNAKGNGNIFARYQDAYQNDTYEFIFVFCDTDRKPYEQYSDIKKKINDFHDNNNAATSIIIFGNPCTMQIIILHFCDKILKSNQKKKNKPIIKEFCGIDNYNANEAKRALLFEKITEDNYNLMKSRIVNLPTDDSIIGSTNFHKIIDCFSNEDTSWINDYTKMIEY